MYNSKEFNKRVDQEKEKVTAAGTEETEREVKAFNNLLESLKDLYKSRDN